MAVKRKNSEPAGWPEACEFVRSKSLKSVKFWRVRPVDMLRITWSPAARLLGLRTRSGEPRQHHQTGNLVTIAAITHIASYTAANPRHLQGRAFGLQFVHFPVAFVTGTNT
jgi:hypothetical protein